MTRRLVMPALFVSMVTLAVACGDDEAADGDTTTTIAATTTTTEATTTTVADATTTTEPVADDDAAVEVTVTIRGFAFDPAVTTVELGTTVKWLNLDGVSHTATADDGTFNGSVTGSRSFSFTAAEAGEYPYHCTIHPEMRATLIVEG
jgi:plastocyanin